MKRILALAVAFFASSLLFAQIQFGVGARGYLGIPAGSTLSEDLFDSKYAIAPFEGIGFGISADVVVMQQDMKGFGVELDLGYAHNEIGWEATTTEFDMKGKISYSSFDIPLLVGYTFAKGNFRITPQIGPYASIPIGSVKFDLERVESEGVLVSNATNTTNMDVTSKFLYGCVGGIAIGYKVGKGLVNFDGRYMADLAHLKINHHAKDGVTLMTRRKITFGLSYTYFF
ncbi:MAG: PorT family protein [Treponema sp.]|nr:PorT family protein [Treponema sp.]